MSAKPGDLTFVPPPDLTGERRDWHDGAVDHKARRLLITGKVRLVEVGRANVTAIVRGDSGSYTVRFERDRWSCTCPSADDGQRCSHRAAVELVTGDRT